MNSLTKNTSVGRIPIDWDQFYLSELSEFITKGSTPTTYGFEWQSEGIPFLRSECVTEIGFNKKGLAFISLEAHNALTRSKISSGDILISITGNVGRIAIYPDSYEEGNINQHIARVRIINDICIKKFIYYQLLRTECRNYFNGIVTGAAYPQLSLKQIREVPIYLPPIHTQQKIASILSAYDDLIENNLKRIKLLEEMAQQTYEEWFVRMRFPGYENAVMNEEMGLPEGWEKVKLGDVCDLQQGFALNKKSANYISETRTDFPLLKISDLINQTETLFVNENIPNQFKIDFEDIIYSRTGNVGLAFIGKRGIAYNNCFKVKPFSEDLKYYLLHFLKQPLTIQIARSLATGTAQPDLNHSAFKSITFLKPTDDIIISYSKFYRDTIRIIQNLQYQNQRLKEARDILLPRLMRGMIEV